MKAIVAVTRNWGIGMNNKLLCSIPEDMKFFRTTTTGNVVVMGRKTLESFPNGNPLKNRVNIVITRDPSYDGKGAIVVHSKEELMEKLEEYDTDTVYVIGGESIYKLLLQDCDTIHVTHMDVDMEADAFFPNLSENPKWTMTEKGDDKEHEGIKYCFTTYNKVK